MALTQAINDELKLELMATPDATNNSVSESDRILLAQIIRKLEMYEDRFMMIESAINFKLTPSRRGAVTDHTAVLKVSKFRECKVNAVSIYWVAKFWFLFQIALSSIWLCM